MPDYPEHQKLKAIVDKSQACGEFLNWLTRARGFTLGQYHEHTEACRNAGRTQVCGMSASTLYPTPFSERRLLAEYFEIDEQKLDDEKRAMLEEQRALNEGRG